MKPGIELDTLIAEKVMGWKEGKHPHQDVLDAGVFGGGYRFSPSIDIGDAWQVVEKMRAGGHYFEAMATKGEGGMWPPCSAGFQTSNGPRFQNSSEAMPHAICLAALKAVGVELGG